MVTKMPSSLGDLWRRLTPTKALENSSGEYERQFFDLVYRISYLTGTSSREKGFLYFIYSAAIKLIIVSLVISELWYLFSQTSNLDKIVDNINVTLIHLIMLYKYGTMLRQKKMYMQLASATTSENFDVSTPERKKLVEFWSQRNKRYIQLFLFFGIGTVGVWSVFPLVDDVEYNFILAVRLPFEHSNRTIYPITYLWVLVSFNYISHIGMNADFIMQTHLMHLSCQFAVLGDCFQNIINECTKEQDEVNGNLVITQEWTERYMKRLENLVAQHKYILSNTTRLKEAWRTPMFFQLLASSLLICFAGYQMAVNVSESFSKFVLSVMYLGSVLLELYIFYRWCDEIGTQSESIADAVYASGWEGGVASLPGVRLRLMLVIMRAKKPTLLTAGGLYDLSLASYGMMVKAGYSALTMLLRVRDN